MEKHIGWLEPEEKELERNVLAEYSIDEIRKHLEYLTTLTRIAGTGDEQKAMEYIKGKLEEYGIDVEIQEFDAYISHPGKAELKILSPDQKSFPCLPHAFISSTPPEGIEAELISLGRGLEEDYKGVDARGKIVLIEPGGGEGQVRAARVAEERGAAAQVHIHIESGGKRAISFMQLRDTWGGPTPETISRIPKTPAISICNEDGRYLVELTQKGRVVANLKADTWKGYTKVRHPIGILKGTKEPQKYILFSAHYCSWYGGATDNAVANSILLETARILSKYRKRLGRSVKFAWWTGHSQGTFAGSTWYVDNFWDDVRDNVIAYVNMDGLGKKGSSMFEAANTEEIRKFHERVVKDVLGSEVKSKRVSKSGDQSFWGMGLPSVMGSTTFSAGPGAPKGEKIWYTHTSEDTLDKVDMEVIAIPFKVNAVSILRLCNNPVLPFEFVTVAELFKTGLNDLQKGGKSVVDLTSLVTQVEALEKKAKALNKGIGENLSIFGKKKTAKGLKSKFEEINTCLMELSRILISALSSKAGKYGQDPMGTKFYPVPTLQPLEKLNLMAPDSEEYKALRTSLLRERNKVSDILHLANGLLDRTLEAI